MPSVWERERKSHVEQILKKLGLAQSAPRPRSGRIARAGTVVPNLGARRESLLPVGWLVDLCHTALRISAERHCAPRNTSRPPRSTWANSRWLPLLSTTNRPERQ